MILRLQDVVLIAVVFSAILTAFVFPRFAALFEALPVYCLMAVLFLSFLPISVRAVWKTVRHSAGFICYLLIVKLIVLPTLMFFAFRWSVPRYAVTALLLSGISTGVMAPYFATLLSANNPLVLVIVVGSSLLVPFTLPALVKVLAGQSLQIPFSAMVQMLGAVVVIPFAAAQLLQRLPGRMMDRIVGQRQSISLVLFAVINLGVFSKYSDYFFRKGAAAFMGALLMAVVFAGLYFAVGLVSSLRMAASNQLSTIISFAHMNNVLVVVFSARFFGPVEPTVAGLYTIPFFLLLFPLRAYQKLQS